MNGERRQSDDGPRGGPDITAEGDGGTWRRLIEALPQWTWTADADGAVDYFSPQALAFTGRTLGALRGGGWMEVLHPEDRPRVAEAWRTAIESRTAFELEPRFRGADGAYRWFLLRGLPSRGPSNQVVRWSGIAIDVTDRHLREQKSTEIYGALRRAAELAHLSVWAWELRGPRVGDAVPLRLIWPYGLDSEATPQTFDTACPRTGILPEDAERLARAIQACLDGETPIFAAEYRAMRPDGVLRWRLARGIASRDADGRATGFVGTAIDITDEKQTAEEILHIKERLERAAKISQLSMWEFVMTDGLASHSQLIVDKAIMSQNPLPVATDFESVIRAAGIVAEDQRAIFRTAIQDCVDGKTPDYQVEFQCRRIDGLLAWRYARGNVLRGPDGTPTRIVGSAIDITGRKRAEEETKRASHLLQMAVRGSNIHIWNFDMPDGRIETCRHTFVNVWEYLGYDPETAPTEFGQAMRLAVHPDDQVLVGGAIQGCLDSDRRDFEVTYRVRRQDGTERWQLARGIVQRTETGKPIRLTGTSVDITALKRVEAELDEARRAAESANRAKDDFLANVSHEIRTPMNAILGMTELALESSATEHQRHLLRTVKSAADSLLVVINDLLDFSKIEAGKLGLDSADFSLRAVLADTLRALAPRAHHKGLELICNVASEVPDELVGDPQRLRQVLLNVVGNAVKFTDQGEVFVDVSWRANEPSASTAALIRFTVIDTGIGIPREQQERIFRAFEQEDTSTTRRFGGTGLGLTIASRLVALMGGMIGVESNPGRGSTFVFTARFARQALPVTPAASSIEALPVLIVDDNATSRHVIEGWLRGWGMKPTAVADAPAAMKALLEAAEGAIPFALALIDARLPGTDGWSLAAQVRERAPLSGLRIVMMSSADRPSDPTRARESRIGAQLLKPVLQDDLLDSIGRVMGAPPAEASLALHPGSPYRVPLPRRILLAEDNEFSAQFMVQLLTQYGHTVQLATDGRLALELAQEGTFDLLVLDLHMPELDGFDVTRAIRARESTTGGRLPIVALTARSRKEDRDRCLAAGMDDFLTKPVPPGDLLAAIDRLAGEPDELAGLFDAAALLRACGGEESALRILCRGFCAHLPERMAEAGDALRTGSAGRLREAAHKLCALLFVFSTAAGEVASAMEDLASEGRLDECRALFDRLDTMTAQLLPLATSPSIEELRRQAGSNLARASQ